MAVFEYTAIDSLGKPRKGILNADSPSLAGQKLKSRGYYPTSLNQVRGESGKKGRKSFRLFAPRVKQLDVVASIRQLATLLSAGLPLVQSLSGVLDQMRDTPLKRILAQTRERVNEGMTLAAAMEEHPQVFGRTFTAMIKAGESSGTLELVLERLADFQEQQLALRRKIQSTLAYPLLMLLVGGTVVFFLLAYVIPKVTQIFLDLEQALPLPTVILIKTSGFLQKGWWVLLLGGLALFLLLRRFLDTEKGRAMWDVLLLRIPLVGDLLKKIAIARFSRALGTLLAN
ncbi:MAG: type II secretion system F family protein, partial [Desulfovibrionales bacterium]